MKLEINNNQRIIIKELIMANIVKYNIYLNRNDILHDEYYDYIKEQLIQSQKILEKL